MKKLNLIILFLAITSISYAQTNTFPSSGNVGVGTTAPFNPLTIIGNNGGTNTSNTATFSSNYGSSSSIGNQINITNLHTSWGLVFGFDGPGVSSGNYHGANAGYLINVQNAPLYFGTNNAATMMIGAGGNVGIGTLSPVTALQIGSFLNGSSNNQLSIPGTYNFEQVRLGQIGNGNSALEFVNHSSISNSYGIKFLVNIDSGSPGLQLQYAPNASSYGGLSYSTGLYMDMSGNIAIGTINNAGYKLAVNGSAIATSMTVKLNANWPDYVFKKDYQLPSLTEVKSYIDQNHHLPDMPSEQEVVKDGINLGEMNKLLTKKVEELTLYLIEQNKQIIKQQTAMEAQQKQIDQLNKKFRTSTKAQTQN